MLDAVERDNQIIIYGIVEGPFHSDEVRGWDEDECWMVLCQTENPFGGIQLEEVTFWTFDDAYEVVKHFKEKRTPLIIESEVWDD